jgi:hypothetical protein
VFGRSIGKTKEFEEREIDSLENFQNVRPLVIFLQNFYGGIHSIGISKDLIEFNHVRSK